MARGVYGSAGDGSTDKVHAQYGNRDDIRTTGAILSLRFHIQNIIDNNNWLAQRFYFVYNIWYRPVSIYDRSTKIVRNSIKITENI